VGASVPPTCVMPGGNTRSVLHFDPFPFRVASARRSVSRRRRRTPLRRPPRQLHRRAARPFARRRCASAAHTTRSTRGWASGVGPPQRSPARRTDRRTFRRDRAGALHQFGNRGQPDGTRGGDEPHRPEPGCSCSTAATTAVCSRSAAHREVNVPHDWIVSTIQRHRGRRRRCSPLRASSIAAVLVEPLQGSAGCMPGRPGLPLRSLRRHCDRLRRSC
jgi:glutamate-1-semialdehyde 2,1-aminomutase